MREKYFNDAVIGNKQMVASYSSKGELLRMYYNSPDYKQFIEYMYYTENTNILNTEIRNTYFNLHIIQTDFVPVKQNVLVKRYTFTNQNTIDLDVKFLIHSKLLSNDNNFVSGKLIRNGMMQYSHDYSK